MFSDEPKKVDLCCQMCHDFRYNGSTNGSKGSTDRAMAKKINRHQAKGTGSIYEDGEGYRARIEIEPGLNKKGELVRRFKKVKTKTHDEAVKALARLQQQQRTHGVAPASGLNLAGYVDDWLETRTKPFRAPKTYQQYKWLLTTHVVPTLGKKRIDAVTRQDVQRLISNLAKQPVQDRTKPEKEAVDYPGKPGPKPKPKVKEAKPEKSPVLLSTRTLSLTKTVLHALFECAIRDGLANQNPATYIDLPRASTKPPQFLTTEQVVALNEKLEDSHVKELAHFMLATGARLGEATGIRWQDVDLEKRFVTIAGQLQRSEKKLQYRPTTKTNQDRTLVIPEWLATELKTMKAKQMVNDHKDPEGIAFLNPYGRRFDPKYVYNELAAVCVLAEIPAVSPHKLRHTFATAALMETNDMHGVQKMLGHQQIALTTNLYGHATAERTRLISDAVGKAFNPKR